jgi:hypothetical protein
MEEALRRNDYKGTWQDCEVHGYLWGRLTQEKSELQRALMGSDPTKIGREAADVANIAMMIADQCTPVARDAAWYAPPPEAPQPIGDEAIIFELLTSLEFYVRRGAHPEDEVEDRLKVKRLIERVRAEHDAAWLALLALAKAAIVKWRETALFDGHMRPAVVAEAREVEAKFERRLRGEAHRRLKEKGDG